MNEFAKILTETFASRNPSANPYNVHCESNTVEDGRERTPRPRKKREGRRIRRFIRRLVSLNFEVCDEKR